MPIKSTLFLPRIAPLRPTRSKTVPVGREWIYELKLDGFRGVLTIDEGRGHFTSKNAKPLKRFDDLANAIARTMPVKNAIFDGEIIVMGAGCLPASSTKKVSKKICIAVCVSSVGWMAVSRCKLR